VSAASPRVRFAPAPSGWLHVGSVRTALFNWLHARHHGGTFIFRIEDTDASRATDESMQSMMEAMRWLGLDWDEGVGVEGPHGPYRQSQRADLHAAVARRLEALGVLYRDGRTAVEMDAWRGARRDAKLPPVVKRSSTPAATDGGEYTLRLELPEQGSITVNDLVRDDITWQWANESDPVLVRSNGAVTYPLANTVDDIAQGVTLVCRGEDLLSVTPRQAFLYDLLIADGLIDDALEEVGLPPRAPGWTKPSEFAHLSMIVGQDRKKLSKRHGAVAIQELARQGFLPETLVNYIALLGWAPSDTSERLSRDELIAAFSLDDVGRSAAAFDQEKLTAFNGERIRELAVEELADRLMPYLDGTFPPDAAGADSAAGEAGESDEAVAHLNVRHEDAALIGAPPSPEEVALVRGLVPLVQERMQRLDEVHRYAPAFFSEGVELDPSAVDKVLGKPGAVEVLERALAAFAVVAWDAQEIEAVLRPMADELGLGFGKVAQPIRVATTGSTVSPPLFESLALLPREHVLARLAAALPLARAGQA